MNRAVLARAFGSLRVRLIVCGLALVAWGAVLPVIYSAFGKALGASFANNPILSQLSQFGGGDLFTLPGSIALGFIHPITLLLMSIVAVGFPLAAIAGERQRGTLEVILARPISRHTLYLTLFAAGAVALALLMAAELLGVTLSAQATGVGSELALGNVVLLWFNGWLLFLAIMSIAFAASVSFDRLGPALGITLAVVVVSYFLDVIGSLWPDAAWVTRYSIFDLVQAKRVLTSGLVPEHVVILLAITLVAAAFAWIEFPRRDLAAPS